MIYVVIIYVAILFIPALVNEIGIIKRLIRRRSFCETGILIDILYPLSFFWALLPAFETMISRGIALIVLAGISALVTLYRMKNERTALLYLVNRDDALEAVKAALDRNSVRYSADEYELALEGIDTRIEVKQSGTDSSVIIKKPKSLSSLSSILEDIKRGVEGREYQDRIAAKIVGRLGVFVIFIAIIIYYLCKKAIQG